MIISPTLDYWVKEYKPFLRPWIHISNCFQRTIPICTTPSHVWRAFLKYPLELINCELRTAWNLGWRGSSERWKHSIFWWIIHLSGFSLMENLHIHSSPLSPLPDPAWNQFKEPPMRASAVGRVSVLLWAQTPRDLGKRPSKSVPSTSNVKILFPQWEPDKGWQQLFSMDGEFANCLDESFMTDGSLRTTQNSHRDQKP